MRTHFVRPRQITFVLGLCLLFVVPSAMADPDMIGHWALDDGAGTPANSGNGVLDGGETVIVQKTLANGIDISATTLPGDWVAFNTQGIASTAGTITLTDNSGDTSTDG